MTFTALGPTIVDVFSTNLEYLNFLSKKYVNKDVFSAQRPIW